MKKSGSQKSKSPFQLIDARIKELGDWRGKMLSRLRALVKEADPEVVEEWKWRGVPVWAHDGLICTGETYKSVVKMTFAKGASLKDPSGLFNSSLDGNVRRAIDYHEGDKIDEKALKALVRLAVALNTSSSASSWISTVRRRCAPHPSQLTIGTLAATMGPNMTTVRGGTGISVFEAVASATITNMRTARASKPATVIRMGL